MSVTDQTRSTLVKSYQRYFGKRGGATPSGSSELLSVVVQDDVTWGAHPAARRWHQTMTIGALAANFSYGLILLSTGGGTTRKLDVAVIDRIRFRIGAGSLLNIAFTDNLWGALGIAASTPVNEHSGFPDDPIPNAPILNSTVRFNTTQSAVALTTTDSLLATAGTVHDIFPVGLVMPPERGYAFSPSGQNAALDLELWGRFYESA